MGGQVDAEFPVLYAVRCLMGSSNYMSPAGPDTISGRARYHLRMDRIQVSGWARDMSLAGLVSGPAGDMSSAWLETCLWPGQRHVSGLAGDSIQPSRRHVFRPHETSDSIEG